MNVIPFRRPGPEPEPLAFAIGARVDLRVGAITGGVVRPRAPSREAFQFSALARTLRAARMAWRERRAEHAPLVLAIPDDTPVLEADLLSEAAVEAGATRRSLFFELGERRVIGDSGSLAEDLRARGWCIVLCGDPACPLPFGARARALYSELVIETPAKPDPYMALEGGDRSPLGRRLLAAKAAGLMLTAAQVHTAAQARMLAIAGFDRGGGPFAEAGLR